MTITNIEFKLKDGRPAILRSANENDAEAFVDYMKKINRRNGFFTEDTGRM